MFCSCVTSDDKKAIDQAIKEKFPTEEIIINDVDYTVPIRIDVKDFTIKLDYFFDSENIKVGPVYHFGEFADLEFMFIEVEQIISCKIIVQVEDDNYSKEYNFIFILDDDKNFSYNLNKYETENDSFSLVENGDIRYKYLFEQENPTESIKISRSSVEVYYYKTNQKLTFNSSYYSEYYSYATGKYETSRKNKTASIDYKNKKIVFNNYTLDLITLESTGSLPSDFSTINDMLEIVYKIDCAAITSVMFEYVSPLKDIGYSLEEILNK